MSQSPQFSSSEIAPYGSMQNAAGRLPTPVRVTCILSMIFSGFTLAHHLLGLTVYTTGVNAARNPLGPAYVQYSIINSWVFGILAAVSVISSIGCLARMELARKILVVYAMAYVVANTFSIAMIILYVIPELMQPVMPHMANNGPMMAAANIGAILQGLCCMPVPVLILALFGRPTTLEAFATPAI